jgi:chromosome partitioning protein
MKISTTHNIKAVPGKTPAAVNLAHLAGEADYRTLLWDLDPQPADAGLLNRLGIGAGMAKS